MIKLCSCRPCALILPIASAVVLGGCANQGYSVIASTATTVGVGISQQPANGSVDATLGYKRAEFAFVPTNRNAGEVAGATGNGAKDSGNVIMELRYSGMSDSGIYQRLAVGDLAVQQAGATLMFAKGPDGNVTYETAAALAAVKSLPKDNPEVTAAKVPLAKKYSSIKKSNDAAGLKKFNDAALACGFKSFDSFLIDPNATLQQVQAIRGNLEANGIAFD